MGNFLRQSERDASSLSRFKVRYVKDKFLHDTAVQFLRRSNGNTARLVERLLTDDFMKEKVFMPEFLK
jgi:hypothetical protein